MASKTRTVAPMSPPLRADARWGATALVWFTVLLCGSASAQLSAHNSLRDQFSTERASESLKSRSQSERLRAYARLSDIGTPHALQLLNATVFELLARADRKDEARRLLLELCRHADDSKTQISLLRVLLGSSDSESTDASLRATAALSLAAEGSDSALALLGRALHGEAGSSQLATQALLAHPPRNIRMFLSDPGSVALAQLLGNLADQRAFSTLRRWVKQGNAELQDAALFALAQLGDYEVVPVA